MKWNRVLTDNNNVLQLADETYGTIGYITALREAGDKTAWEIEFSAGDLELYINEVFVGDLDGAKKRLLTTADEYLQSKLKEFTTLQALLREVQRSL